MKEGLARTDQQVEGGNLTPANLDGPNSAKLPQASLDRASRSARSSVRRGKRPVSVVVIDKSALLGAGIASILAGSRFRVAAMGADLSDLSKRAREDRYVTLVSLDEQADGVLPQIARLAEQGVCAIMLSDRFRAEEMLDAIAAGAHGYLLKDQITPDLLLKALEVAWLGGVVITPESGKALNHAIQPHALSAAENASIGLADRPQTGSDAEHSKTFGSLSNRELMILQQLTRGASNKHIARELNIAETTVKVHLRSLLRKLRVRNRTEAAMRAMEYQHGYTAHPPGLSLAAGNESPSATDERIGCPSE
jgi:two-component system nitrate/nitrite response regulator NarL